MNRLSLIYFGPQRQFAWKVDGALSAAGVGIDLCQQLSGSWSEPPTKNMIFVLSETTHELLIEKLVKASQLHDLNNSVIALKTDNVVIPEGVEYVDFSGCENSAPEFHTAMRTLQHLLNIDAIYSEADKEFFGDFYNDFLRDIELDMNQLTAYIEGALAAEQSFGSEPGWMNRADSTMSALKWRFQDCPIYLTFERFRDAVQKGYIENDMPRVAAIILRLVNEFIELLSRLSFRYRGSGEAAYFLLAIKAYRVFSAVNALRQNFEMIKPINLSTNMKNVQ